LGANYRGQLGDGKSGVRLTNGAPNIQSKPVRTVEGRDWVEVQAGFSASYALKRDGSLWAWGLNNFGQLGVGSWSDSPRPVQVGVATNWAKIRAGGVSAAGIQSDGTLWIWGGSPSLGNTTPQSPRNLLVPTRLTAETNWIDVSVAFNVWLGIKSDGTLWAWGRLAHLFTGASPDAAETPVRLGHDTDWQSVASSGGSFHHLLRKRDGTFWIMDASWGDRATVKLTKVNLPANVVAWDAGGHAIAAITSDGEVWTCGTVLGQHGTRVRLLRFAEKVCWGMGWKVRWDIDAPTITREQPWRLRNEEPKD
jgi:alpha-tubulin suppressor-like RCC1 family protein